MVLKIVLRNIYSTIGSLAGLLIMFTILVSCSSEEKITQDLKPRLLRVNFKVGNQVLKRAVEGDENTIYVGGIVRRSQISDVWFNTTEGVKVTPNPADVLQSWKKEQKFVVGTSNSSSQEYTIVMSDFIEYANGKNANFKVIGYLRSRGFKDISKMDLSKTNYMNLSFANLDSNGKLFFKDNVDITNVVEELKSLDIKVMMSIGGGGVTDEMAEPWQQYVKVDRREELVSNIMDYVELYNLDGIDVDFENDFLLSLGENYDPFIKLLKEALHAEGKEITTALPTKRSFANVSQETLESFDFINVMSYTATGPWNPERVGPHSPMSILDDVYNFWVIKKGIAKEKIILGLPFYGQDFANFDKWKWGLTWPQIIDGHPEYAYLDQVDKLYYNGIPTIAKKTHDAMEMFGGVMVWSYGLDKYNEMSLLRAINQVVDAGLKEGVEIQTFFADEDGDGYGNIYKPFQAYEQPEGYVLDRKDSNDQDASIHP
ncbi:DUF4971 domain-containing protein [Halosquirtibacter xylanolyticus]|uniref:glycosyl hydrolase family 18 protein n=1 Tax=Halosquirtibacter xylanolyticus TaxID=3374599 RepID=UPI00374A0A8C|nr:DUF4971 domain-containing protein [Prolixibacteraceae bacterium]